MFDGLREDWEPVPKTERCIDLSMMIAALLFCALLFFATIANAQNVSSPAVVTAVTVTNASAQAVGSHERYLLALDNESATATVACAFGATAAINTAGSFTIGPGQTRTWTGQRIPSDAINCISSVASSPLTVEE